MMKLRQILLRSRGTSLLLAAVFCALFLNGVEYIVHNHAAEQRGYAGQLNQLPSQHSTGQHSTGQHSTGQHSTGPQGNGQPDSGSAPHADQCGYCAAFSGLSSASDAPVFPGFALTLALVMLVGVLAAPVLRRPFTVAQPRGPPRY